MSSFSYASSSGRQLISSFPSSFFCSCSSSCNFVNLLVFLLVLSVGTVGTSSSPSSSSTTPSRIFNPSNIEEIVEELTKAVKEIQHNQDELIKVINSILTSEQALEKLSKRHANTTEPSSDLPPAPLPNHPDDHTREPEPPKPREIKPISCNLLSFSILVPSTIIFTFLLLIFPPSPPPTNPLPQVIHTTLETLLGLYLLGQIRWFQFSLGLIPSVSSIDQFVSESAFNLAESDYFVIFFNIFLGSSISTNLFKQITSFLDNKYFDTVSHSIIILLTLFTSTTFSYFYLIICIINFQIPNFITNLLHCVQLGGETSEILKFAVDCYSLFMVFVAKKKLDIYEYYGWFGYGFFSSFIVNLLGILLIVVLVVNVVLRGKEVLKNWNN